MGKESATAKTSRQESDHTATEGLSRTTKTASTYAWLSPMSVKRSLPGFHAQEKYPNTSQQMTIIEELADKFANENFPSNVKEVSELTNDERMAILIKVGRVAIIQSEDGKYIRTKNMCGICKNPDGSFRVVEDDLQSGRGTKINFRRND
jgi:hypothetical protein